MELHNYWKKSNIMLQTTSQKFCGCFCSSRLSKQRNKISHNLNKCHKSGWMGITLNAEVMLRLINYCFRLVDVVVMKRIFFKWDEDVNDYLLSLVLSQIISY